MLPLEEYLESETYWIMIHVKSWFRPWYLQRLTIVIVSFLAVPSMCWISYRRSRTMGAQVISHKRKYDHISKEIQELHWLKIPEWIKYKVAVLTFKCVKGDAQTYLKDLINTTHNHALHSTTNNYLPVSMSKLSQVHKSSFSIMAGRN